MSETDGLLIKPIAHIYNDYHSKFGVPRQSGLIEEVVSRVVLAPEYRRAEALRGIEDFSHLWLIWQFNAGFAAGSSNSWQPTVRPPRLGGNVRVGVFASRSPNRPNKLGLSVVRLLAVDYKADDGPVLLVSGADCLNATPIFDIKPYVPYADSVPQAKGGFAVPKGEHQLKVNCPAALLDQLPQAKRAGLLAVLAADPRPGYQQEAERLYGLSFAGFNVRFFVAGDELTVTEIAAEKPVDKQRYF